MTSLKTTSSLYWLTRECWIFWWHAPPFFTSLCIFTYFFKSQAQEIVAVWTLNHLFILPPLANIFQRLEPHTKTPTAAWLEPLCDGKAGNTLSGWGRAEHWEERIQAVILLSLWVCSTCLHFHFQMDWPRLTQEGRHLNFCKWWLWRHFLLTMQCVAVRWRWWHWTNPTSRYSSPVFVGTVTLPQKSQPEIIYDSQPHRHLYS